MFLRMTDEAAPGEDGSEFVVEDQYGRADHDQLTRGLASWWRDGLVSCGPRRTGSATSAGPAPST